MSGFLSLLLYMTGDLVAFKNVFNLGSNHLTVVDLSSFSSSSLLALHCKRLFHDKHGLLVILIHMKSTGNEGVSIF